MAQIIYFKQLTSTNDYAKEHIDELEHQSIIYTDLQTKGKGRMGKNWSAKGENILMSLVYKNQIGDISLFPLLSALAVAKTLQQQIDFPVQIKWPNDIILNQKKICGILCESIIGGAQTHVVCGIGINVNMTQEQFEIDRLPYATSLQVELNRTFDRLPIIKQVGQQMNQLVTQLQQSGFLALKQEYEELLINRGKQVQVIYQNQVKTGIALGITEAGNLICDCDGERLFIHSGEASVRGLYGYV